MTTSDDCLNAGDSIEINSGYILVVSSANNAIGTLTFNGGMIVAAGDDAPEEAFDCDRNTLKITGGILAELSGATSKPTASVCTQNVVILGDGSEGETVALESDDETVAFVYTASGDYDVLLLSSPEIITETG